MGNLRRFDFRSLHARGYNRFIETGTGKGWGCDYMIKSGFSNIETVEQSSILAKRCFKKYNLFKKKHPEFQMNLFQGRSIDFLPKVRTFFRSVVFLDAHFVEGADFGIIPFKDVIGHKDSFPLLDELRIILSKDYTDAVIIIDDARMWFKELIHSGRCPSDSQQWDHYPKLQELLNVFLRTHNGQVIDLDQGYIVLVPKSIPLTVTYSIG